MMMILYVVLSGVTMRTFLQVLLIISHEDSVKISCFKNVLYNVKFNLDQAMKLTKISD